MCSLKKELTIRYNNDVLRSLPIQKLYVLQIETWKLDFKINRFKSSTTFTKEITKFLNGFYNQNRHNYNALDFAKNLKDAIKATYAVEVEIILENVDLKSIPYKENSKPEGY